MLALLLLLNKTDFFNNVKMGYLTPLNIELKNNFTSLGMEFEPNVDSIGVNNFMNNVFQLTIPNILNTFSSRVKKIFEKSIEEGLNKTQIEKLLNDKIFKPYKNGSYLETIVNTEIQTLINFAVLEAGKQVNNPVIKKEWVTQNDDKVRDNHLIDGQVKNLNEKFILVNGVQVEYPGDITAPVEDRVNERCFMAYNVQGRSFAGSDDTSRKKYFEQLVKNKEDKIRYISTAYSKVFQEIQLMFNDRLRKL